MHLRPTRQFRIVTVALALAGTPLAVRVAPAQLPGQSASPDKTSDFFKPAGPGAPVLAPAPFVLPAPGTRAVYSDGAVTVTKATGWRVSVSDDARRSHVIIAGVIADSADVPLIVNERVFAELWPLKVGQQVQFETQRYPSIWRWQVSVVGTERITTDAGTFDCYVIDAMVMPVTGRTSLSDRTLYWYAPSINTVVRSYQRRDGELVVRERAHDLVRLERPGMPAVGIAAGAPATRVKKRAVRPR